MLRRILRYQGMHEIFDHNLAQSLTLLWISSLRKKLTDGYGIRACRMGRSISCWRGMKTRILFLTVVVVVVAGAGAVVAGECLTTIHRLAC